MLPLPFVRRLAAGALLVGAPALSSCSATSHPPAPRAPAAVTPAAAPTVQHRPDVSGRSGAVVCDHPLASPAGYDVLLAGGNAGTRRSPWPRCSLWCART